MAAEIEDPAAAGDSGSASEEVKPYRIHVSSRYLNLTKQKLEIARLPHELDDPKSTDWWQPKSQVEPLIDFWLEEYQWRDEEKALNGLPQFRTGFTIPQSQSPIRIQFIHARSSHSNVIPLLIIPPFPLSSLSLGHLIGLFTDPAEANHQPFHVVIPSLPGLGFSDALPANSAVISSTADLLDSLMKRLGYSFYLATTTGTGASSPAHIDYKLADWLSTQYADSCLGTHFISPPLTKPRLQAAPLAWTKWSIARFFEASTLGYQSKDFSALRQSGSDVAKKSTKTAKLPPNKYGFAEPNTLAYALCDSPTGLLVFVMKGLRLLAPHKEFTPAEIIGFTQLAWLPGPEAAMRFWAHCARHPETTAPKKSPKKPNVALTVFLGDEQKVRPQGNSEANADASVYAFNTAKPMYSCPAWAETRYNVLHTNRASGNPGFLVWERPEIIAAGVRGLSAAVLKIDKRLQPSSNPEMATRPQEVEPAAEIPSSTVTTPGEQPSSPGFEIPPKSGLLAPPKVSERLPPVREISDDTKVASHETLPMKTPSPVPATPSPGPPPTTTTTTTTEGG
ncbi:alpha/beta-hydrolase [Xylaria bambusicola]|uniref:alpha/beta-hydrolase n=1 Tax=Xylaria bambusicola TaxID=326684 RepID=UPI002007B2DC|nr:alpha/beta-hydrolase [Xylaria bambusicola]KAI0514390.1 alpha/beta-hydrolase [Xylaria bambusicola]